MSQDFCMGCGVLLSIHSKICPVCGFDNSFDQYQDIPLDEEFLIDDIDDFVPENYPGY